ncbi:hypothetical protein KRX19_05685 [Cardiobacteriaceae bacterium TAE3-ERU3]|nr:hypothetical protein [Cardiobacteriaceae bacterium TAE3-ERU3]
MSFFQMLKTVGRPIGYYPKLAKPLGGANAVILFSHFMYWEGKVDRELGIYKSAAEIEKETGLTVQEQRTARKKLRERGLLVETERRIEHRIYFKLNEQAAEDLLSEFVFGATAAKCNPNSPELQNQHSGSSDSTADELQNQHSYKEQKSTSNSLQEVTSGSESAPPPAPKSTAQKQKRKQSPEDQFVAFLISEGVDEQVARDWWQCRAGKPMTKTAWQRHCREAGNAGITPAAAAQFAAEMQHRGFHAEAYQREHQNFGVSNAVSSNNRGTGRKLSAPEQVDQANAETWAKLDAAGFWDEAEGQSQASG